uniref:Ovule protein n=1 Tax=Ascaris lumbricoides TaxID=6252 RepID=A0A0M3IWJ0_ASCLU
MQFSRQNKKQTLLMKRISIRIRFTGSAIRKTIGRHRFPISKISPSTTRSEPITLVPVRKRICITYRHSIFFSFDSPKISTTNVSF